MIIGKIVHAVGQYQILFVLKGRISSPIMLLAEARGLVPGLGERGGQIG